MYDNNIVQQLPSAEALPFLIGCGFQLSAARNNVLFGNGTFVNDLNNGHPFCGGTVNKQVCLIITDVKDATQFLEEHFFKQAPFIKVFKEIKDFASYYAFENSKFNKFFSMSQCSGIINLYTAKILDKYISLVIYVGNGNGKEPVFNIQCLLDISGQAIPDIVKEWQHICNQVQNDVLSTARMALINAIRTADFVSGANDQLIIFNDNASLQYGAEYFEEDYTDISYAILTIKGEKWIAHNENDLLSLVHKNLEWIDTKSNK